MGQGRHTKIPFASVIDGVSVMFVLHVRADVSVERVALQLQDLDGHRRTLAERKLSDINGMLAAALPWEMMAETTRRDRSLLGQIIQDGDAQREAVRATLASYSPTREHRA